MKERRFIYITEKLIPGEISTGVCRAANDYTIMWWVRPERNKCKTLLTFFDAEGMDIRMANVSLDKPEDWAKGFKRLHLELHLFEYTEVIIGELAARYSEINWDAHELKR